MEFLPHDIVEKILERVPVKSLLRFKSVSKQWKLTTESQYFQVKRMSLSGRKEDVNLVLLTNEVKTLVWPHQLVTSAYDPIKFNFALKPSSYNDQHFLRFNSCDGLLCLYHDDEKVNIVFNLTTGWHRRVPLSTLQQLCHNKHNNVHTHSGAYVRLVAFFRKSLCSNIGLGKDKINGTYKLVRLCNSLVLDLENATTCEVFDFSTNTWRYITPSSPHMITAPASGLYLDGSIYWLTDDDEKLETQVLLSLDLHTENFQVISKAPFSAAAIDNITICSLNNCLCLSVYDHPKQVIWSFNSENKSWKQIYSIKTTLSPLSPLAVLGKNKLLCFTSVSQAGTELVIYDPITDSVYSVSQCTNLCGKLVRYVESLISIL